MSSSKTVYHSILTVGLLLIPLATLALPGDGITLREGLTLSPFAQATLVYDSNVALSDDGNELDDLFQDLVGGLSLRQEKGDLSLQLQGWVQARQYWDYTYLDDEAFQESLNVTYGHRDQLQWTLTQQYSSVFDYEFARDDASIDTPESDAGLRLVQGRTRRTSRELNNVGGSVARDLNRLELLFGAGYSSVEFDDVLRDWSESRANVDLGYRITDKTSATLAGEYGMHETDNNLDDSEFVKARLGVRTKPTDKVAYNLAAGLQTYRATDAKGRSDQLDETTFHFNAAASWTATEKLQFQLSGGNQIVPTSAFDENTKHVLQGSVGLQYQATPTISSSLGASYREDSYSRPIDDIDAEEDLRGLQWGVVYAARRPFLSISGLLRYEESSSNVGEDYDQLRASLALNLTY